jgi:hypothetical protein
LRAARAREFSGRQYRWRLVLRDVVWTVLSDAFIFVPAYRDSIFDAGLRLCIIPVMIGVIAPVGEWF